MSGCSMIVPFSSFRPVEESFDIFVQRFEAAFEANGLEEGKRMPIFVSLLDSEMLKLGNDLFFPSTMKEQPYERLIQRIKLHLAPRKRVIPQRCRFLKRIQLENESVSEYLRELRHLAMDCTFGEMLEVMLRDRFVAGIKSESLQKKLLQEDDDVTLDRVFSIAVSFELAEQNAKDLQDGLVAKMDIVPGGNRKNEARRGWQHGPGSPVTLIPKTIYEKYWKDGKLSPSYLRLRSFCGNPIKIIGERRVFVKEANQVLRLIVVDEDISIVLLGREWLKGLNLDFSRLLNIRQYQYCGSLRICGDFRCTANKAIELDKYPLPSIDEIFSKLSGNTIFSSLDLSRAYLQVRLSEEAKRVVNINTTKGLFAFKRLPYGVAVAPNKFQREMDNLFADMSGVACYIDDILVAGKDHRDHEQKLELVFKRLQEKGLRLNKDKCKFAVNAVEYLGFKIDKKGLHPISSKIEAVVEAPEPTNVSQLRSFIGLLMYYSRFIRNIADILAPFYHLLKKNSKWNWTGEHRILFAKCKALLTNESVLAHYDATRELVLACDASSYGLGVVLSHGNDRKEETPIAFASRTLTEAERRYSQLEKEALSIIFGCEKFRQYLLGREFVLITDNRPLMHIFSPQKPIPICAASRIKRWSLKLSAFKYTVEFRKTDDNGNADALSRLPLVSKTTESLDEDQVLLLRKMSEVPFSFQDVAVETRRDKLLSIVLRNVRENNWQIPKVSQENPLCSYYRIKDELSCEFGCLQWRERVVIPQKLRSSILNDLHEMHLGMMKIKMIARRYFWWPGIYKNIEELARDCRICQESASMPPSTISEWTWPEKPWHRLHLDLAGPFMGRMFMVLVDAYTKWLEIVIIKDITSRTIIGHLREIFARFGLPELLVGEVYHDAMSKQKQFAVGSEVYFRNFANGPKLKRGRIMELLSSRHYLIEDEGRYVKRHINQLRPVIKKEVPEVRDLVLPGTSRDFILPGTSRDHPGLGGQEKTREEAPEVDEELKGAESSAQEDTPEPEPGPAAAAVPVPVRSPRPQRSRRPPEPEPGPAAVPMNMIGSAKTWLDLHKISFTSWEHLKSRLIQDFASDANKEEMKMRLNRMQQWNEPAIRASIEAEDGEYVIEENNRLTQTNGLRLARSLLTVTDKKTHIWITNPYPRPLKIMKDQTLAYGSLPAGVNFIENKEKQNENDEIQFQINKNLSFKEQERLKQMLAKYTDLFSSRLGRTNLAKHQIHTEDAKPIKHKPYGVSAKERTIIKDQIDEMLEEGIIRQSSSPWSFPVILVKKRDGKYRFCVDYRKLNEVTVKDVYPIPRIDDVMDTPQGSKYFSAIDLKSGYWQVEIEERAKEKTAFTTAHGLYEFNVMPFGLCNAPATFERNMDNVLGNLRWQICLCYQDDVIIYSSDFPTHIKRIETVLRCFSESNLKLNAKKCRFAFEELEILGHITNQEGIKPAEYNIKAVRNFPQPKKAKEVQSFLGMCSYYRKYEKDDFIENIKENLSGNKRSITQNFKEENGCLYKKNPNPEGREWLLVVPKKRRREIMSEYHNHMLNGHLGVARTTYRLKNKYYWPSMLKDVSEFVKTCHLCQSRKGSNQLPSGLLQPIPPANYPFERIGIDFVGPLPSTKRRRKWIIVLTDYYT
ncbi:K02A2.6-like, partial [Cordylochernes scorpioides]